jgi:hypothetical protein
VAREFAAYRVALGGAQEFGWDKGGILRVDDCNFFSGKENEKCPLDTKFLYTPENSNSGYNNRVC